ncbi:MAG: Holliday junction resolvase RuvX [Butyrivibrio sp.]|nr:Holliday junction resolvase RuvX [Butyrivibrio sp.]
MRVMGLDYGSRTVGVALSDELLLTAQAREIVRRNAENKLRRTLARLEEIIVAEDVQDIVLGLPVNMDGSMSLRAELAQEFRDKLERRTGIPVRMQDERLTTVEAEEILRANGIPRNEYKKHIDAVAAQVILQDYLDARNRSTAG